ncbi:CDC27 family protein [Sulfurimonas sp. SAG-AH-194-C21]|nr:CDC27 family protein [Sulfurimonas sp. SAG-AH-194-C21]MDF1882503.1 CDC27 family protein [Sulfurimonas sp. SAG-AH-194-C21]
MLNITDLEKRWIRYKVKFYIPHLSIFISLSVILSIFFSFSNNTQEPNDIPHVVKEEPLLVASKESKIKVTPVPISKQETRVIHSTKKVKLSPSLDFMKKMQNSIQPYYNNEVSNKPYTVQKVQKVEAPKIEVVEKEKVLIPEYIPPVKVKKISIKRQNTQNDIYEIITRFKKNNNPALSLFVAKKYYELGDYQQAYNYALITNKINMEIESSWIIFTKSLVKLGKRDKAISTLKKYIKQSHSSGARILLDEIYAGRFK